MSNEIEFYLTDLKSRFDKIKPNTYYLSYSGGKDSHFLYWFIKEYLHRDDIKIVGVNTFMEHQEIRERMYKNSDIILIPEMKPFEIKEKYGIPCFSKQQDEIIERYQNGNRTKTTMKRVNGDKFIGRDGQLHRSAFALSKKARELLLANKLHKISPMCCTILKKQPAHKFQKESGLKPILGVRGGESKLREQQYKSCFTKDGTFTPLWDLSDELMDKIYKQYNIEIPEIYNHVCRTGCMACPYGSYKHDTEKELQLIGDNQRRLVANYFRESYEILGLSPNKQYSIFDLD